VTLQVARSIEELRRILAPIRHAGRSVALVPTMGALHAGHGKLIETARRDSDCVVVSIFVNPIQFDRNADFDRYPRALSTDLEYCAMQGVDIVFAPSVEEMYPCPQQTFVDVSGVSDTLCGQFRPGHFRGVATVVLKLLNIVQPDHAYFGEKDAQQLAVIRRLASDLNVPVAVLEVATVREPDGLALSSRNQHLNADERSIAPALNQALRAAEALISTGASNVNDIKKGALRILEQYPGIRVEYLEIVDPDDLQPVEKIIRAVRVAAAVWIGKTRLIDNVLCAPRVSL
jgi:pantoate--beta-alanine ligase